MQQVPVVCAVRDVPRAHPGEVSTVTICGLLWDIRDETTDWNTINACSAEDEYRLRDLPVEGRLVFDIGAHVGGVGVWLASRGARVIFVEPVPENVAQIEKNLALNGATGEVLRAALGTNRVNLGPEGDAHEFIANIGGVGQARPVECAETTFESMVSEFGLPDIVKLDCEGGEWAVLHDTDIRKVPVIVGEYHPDRPGGGNYTSADIFNFLPNHDVEVGPDLTFGPFYATLRA
jgi:FkbM family methyltransferase